MSDLSSQIDELFQSLEKPSKKEEIKESRQPKSRKVYVDSHALDSLFDDRPSAHQIHDLVEEVVENVIEEVEAQPEPIVPEVTKTRQERMAENLSVYFKKTDQVVEEAAPIGDSQRIKLLEDAFSQMRSAQPATLVSGIGASLDSGGGAVWLWDLDDVNIGVPLDGVYPNIEDGAVLKYDRDNLRWEPGAPGGGSGMGPITDTYLDFDGTDTAQAIRVYGATDKVFEIEVGDIQSDTPIIARFESNPNKLVLPSGQLEASDVHTTTATIGTLNTGTIQGTRAGVLWKLSAGDGLAFDGQASSHIGGTPGETGGNAYSVGFGTLKVGTTVLRTTGAQIITGDKTYTGSTSEAKSLQTKDSVNALISSAISSGFTFQGTTDVTGTAPSSPGAGDFYINLVAGEAAVSWTGIAGATISADQLVIYSGSESRWFAGTVEDNSTFLAKTGGTMTGDIEFAGSQTFPSSLTSGLLPKSGGTMTGTLTTDEVVVPLGKTITIKRGNNNTSIGGLDIKGYQPGQFTVETDIFAVTYGNGTSTGDAINYKGRTDGAGNIQTKSSVQALINANPSTGFVPLSGGIMTGDLQIDISSSNPSNIALEIEEDGATNFRVLRSGTVSSKVLTCTGLNVNGPTATDGSITVTGNIAASGTLSAAGNVTFSNPTEIIGVNTNGSDDVLRQDGRITFTGACDDAFIGKRGGTNNFVKIGAGSGAGKIIATMGVLENGKRSFTSNVGSSDFIGNSTVWNKSVAQSYNVVSGTASTYNGDGSLASATIAAPITFTGNNIHNGTITQNGAVTHNADFTVNSNHAVYFKSAVFQSNGDYNFNGTSNSNLTQKIRNKGQASKVLMITATDTGNGEQNILSLAYAGSQFYRPITVPTPTANAHAATKQYVDQNSSTIQTGTNSNPSLSSGEMYWNTSLKVLYVGN